MHSQRCTTVKIQHPAYDTIDEAFRPSEKNETYCLVNMWSCYNQAGVSAGVLFCNVERPRLLLNTVLYGPTEEIPLDTERRIERALTPPEVASKAMPKRSSSLPAGIEGPQEFLISSARDSDAILPDGSAPEPAPPRPKKQLPQCKDVPPKPAPPGHESVANEGAGQCLEYGGPTA
jgi:hypothetical protein